MRIASFLLLGLTSTCLFGCDPTKPPPKPEAPRVEVTRENLVEEAVSRVCSALARCCDDESQARFFEPFVRAESFNDLDSQLPPEAVVTPESCPVIVTELLTRRPFGAWLPAVDRGEVTLDLAAAAECLEELDASCGPDLASALADPTCFALGPPNGGDEQRRMFLRTAVEGPCTVVRDGIGGLYYGTCDSDRAFCCFGETECGFPPEGAVGECVPVVPEGEACSLFAPLALCATGQGCDLDAGCRTEGEGPLQLGEACVDDAFFLLGKCVDSFCDVLGSGTCRPIFDEGEACSEGSQCRTGVCDAGVCVTDPFCVGIP